ncbi:hypothetical protein [Winogradskyella sp. PE311]|uniref:hypothetical protein n=1 Tax=Winogradskyella sp. PE311 TaxID=3366943 RepID=UPI0039813091
MKKLYIQSLLILFTVNASFAQQWMTDLKIAQSLAQVQNKMVLMVWEETTQYEYPVLVNDDSGRTILITNLFDDQNVSPLIWKHFVPVIVNENKYADLYEEIRGKRKQTYIDKFNDDSIKIMDVNGNIINVNYYTEEFQNISRIIESYSINTRIIENEIEGYKKEKTFYTSYYLAAKYLDMALYVNKNVRPNIMALSDIYLNEAISFLEGQKPADRVILKQRCDLLKIQQALILKRSRKALRQLKKIKAEAIEKSNLPFISFLYFTAYISLNEPENAELWKSNISSVNLKKAWFIINLNK